MYRPEIAFADASILSTALGGDQYSDPYPVYVIDARILLLFPPGTMIQILRMIVIRGSCTHIHLCTLYNLHAKATR